MADQLSVTGKFLAATPVKTVGQNNMQVRNFWVDLTDKPEYPNTPEFQLRGDKVLLVDNLPKGQTIQVKFNINGRRYKNQQGRDAIITNLDAWQINIVQVQSAAARPALQQPAPQASPAASSRPQPSAQSTAFANAGEDDDLPF